MQHRHNIDITQTQTLVFARPKQARAKIELRSPRNGCILPAQDKGCLNKNQKNINKKEQTHKNKQQQTTKNA